MGPFMNKSRMDFCVNPNFGVELLHSIKCDNIWMIYFMNHEWWALVLWIGPLLLQQLVKLYHLAHTVESTF